MGIRNGAVLAAALTFAGTGAFAQVDDWRGLYGGLTLGTGEVHNDLEHNAVGGGGGGGAGGGGPQDVDASGATGGIVLGYNQVKGNIIYGFEADFMLGGLDGTVASGGGSHSVDIDALATLRGRVGLRTGTRGMVYGTAGLAGQRATISHSGAHPDWTETYVGWTAGIGYERALSNGARVGVEALYLDFGSATDVHTPGGGGGGPHELVNDASGTLIRVRATFPF